MHTSDTDREISEQRYTMQDFVLVYNKNIPSEFPKATEELLKKFRSTYPALFKGKRPWSLDKHRKKFMDWPTLRSSSTQK